VPLTRRDALRYLGLSAGLQLAFNTAVDAESEPDDHVDSGVDRLAPWRLAGGRTVIPFTLYGRTGKVTVTYGVTEDMVASGYDVVLKPGFDPAMCRGYPTVKSAIDAYSGAGYSTLWGWIQVVTAAYYGPGGEGATPVETTSSVDKLPSMMDIDVPFASFGNSPQAFDAPCRNLNGHTVLRWTADTFLTTVPIRTRDEEIHRVIGFRWGYREYDPESHRPVAPMPLEVTGRAAWNACLPVMRTNCPSWRFAGAS
jgi:hypothetical protein